MLASARREATRRVGFARAGRDARRRGRRGACRGARGRSDESSKGHGADVVPTPFVSDLAGPSAQILLVHPRWSLQSAHLRRAVSSVRKLAARRPISPRVADGRRAVLLAHGASELRSPSLCCCSPAGIELKRTPLVPLSAASRAGGRIGSQTTIETAEPLRARRRRSQHGFGQGCHARARGPGRYRIDGFSKRRNARARGTARRRSERRLANSCSSPRRRRAGPPKTTCFAARERRSDTRGYVRRARGDQQRRPLGGRSQPRPDLDSHHIDAMHSQVERSLAHADAALAAMLQNAAVLHQCTSDDAFYLYLSQWHSRGRLTEPNPIIYLRAVRHSAGGRGGPHVQRHRLPGPRLQYLSRPERRRALEFRGATGLVLPCGWIG